MDISDQELMDKVKAIRDKTGKFSWFQIDGDAFDSGMNKLQYVYGTENREDYKDFSSRTELVAHMDKLLEE